MIYGFPAADPVPDFLRLLTRAALQPRTPRRLVWWRNKARLFHYPRAGSEDRSTPLLIVYSPIGRPTILDLYPGHSFVDWMRHRGFDVFLLDWGRPGPEDRSIGLTSYVDEYLPRVVRTVKRLTSSRECNLLGWSVGGLFSAIYAALFPEELRNLVLITAPLRFRGRRTMPLAGFGHASGFAHDRLPDNVPGEMIALGAVAADPYHAAIRPYFDLWGHLTDRAFVQHWQAVRAWASDVVPLTGALFRDMAVELYRNNRLMQDELMIGERRVELGQIRARLLNIVAVDDRITPPWQSERLLDVVGSRQKQNLRIPGTHVESMAGIRAPQQTWPRIYDWLAERPIATARKAKILRFPSR